MAVTEYIVKNGQSLFDVALQLYGDVSGIGDLLLNNPKVNFGSDIKIGDVLSYDTDNIVNITVTKYLTANGITVSNGVGHVYQKITDEDMKLILFVRRDFMRTEWQLSGTGSIVVDWGDNTELQAIALSSVPEMIEHNYDSDLSSAESYRKVKLYGDFTLETFDIKDSEIHKVFAINEFDMGNITISENVDLTNVGFFDVVQDLKGILATGITIETLMPLISQEELRDLWINESNLSSEVLDNYFIGLVTKYESRPPCNVRMWGNNSPSGIYQRPDVLFDPQSGLEAMWVLENERGWTIQEIISPPTEGDIVRRFETRDDQTVFDSISEKNAQIYFPISKFVAANSSRILTGINAATINYLEFVMSIESKPASEQTLIGAHDSIRGTHFKVNITTNGFIALYHGSDVSVSDIALDDGEAHLVQVDDINGDGARLYVDSELIGQLAVPSDSVIADLGIGCLLHDSQTPSDYSDVLMRDVVFGDSAYIIPLPHLGYDIVSGAKYTTNNIESMDMSRAGSTHMQKYGAVARRPNLLLNGFSEKISFSGDPHMMYSEGISGLSGEATQYELRGIGKVTQEAIDAGVSCRLGVFCRDIDSNIIKTVNVNFSGTSYESKNEIFEAPNGCVSMSVFATHDPSGTLDGNSFIKEISLREVLPEWIPNKMSGEALLPVLSSDIVISGSDFLNNTPFKIDFGVGPTQEEFIWDKSRGDVWNNEARVSPYYDSVNPALWDMYEFNQQFIVDNINSDYLHISWIKTDANVIKDIFQYPLALIGDNKARCDRYVHLTT